MAGMVYSVRYSEYMVTDWATGSCRKLLASTHGKRLRLCLSLSFADLLHSVRTSSSFSELVDTSWSIDATAACCIHSYVTVSKTRKQSEFAPDWPRHPLFKTTSARIRRELQKYSTLVRPPSISISGFPSSFHPVPQRSLWIDDNQTLTFAFVCVASNRTHNLESSQFHLRH